LKIEVAHTKYHSDDGCLAIIIGNEGGGIGQVIGIYPRDQRSKATLHDRDKHGEITLQGHFSRKTYQRHRFQVHETNGLQWPRAMQEEPMDYKIHCSRT